MSALPVRPACDPLPCWRLVGLRHVSRPSGRPSILAFRALSGRHPTSLGASRQREFQAGRYNPATPFPHFPPDLNAPSPGAQHHSIEDAFDDADADGARRLLLRLMIDNAGWRADEPRPDRDAEIPERDDILRSTCLLTGID